METVSTSERSIEAFSPHNRIKKKRRRLSRLSLKKHFRKSLIHDRVRPTMPNKSLTIIEISSTDDSSIIDNSRNQSPRTPSLKHSDSEEVISPSPNKNDDNMRCLSTGKKRINEGKLGEKVTDKNNAKITSGKGEVCDYKVEYIIDSQAFLEFSLLDYDNFRKPKVMSNNMMNSTMVKPQEVVPDKKSDISENSNNDMESIKSCENVLDDIYGDSWRPFKEKVLPKSERKPQKKRVFIGVPASERKVSKKSEILKNENEKHMPDNLLKNLQQKILKKAMDSPLYRNFENINEKSSVDKFPEVIRTKLNFDEEKEPLEEKNDENKDNFCWSDGENSFEKLSLEERLRKKILKEKDSNERKPKEDENSDDKLKNILTIGDSKTTEIIPSVEKKVLPTEINQNLSSSPEENPKNVEENVIIKKKVRTKKLLKKKLYNSNEIHSDEDDDKKVLKFKESPNEDRKIKKKLTKKATKTRYFQSSSEDSDNEEKVDKKIWSSKNKNSLNSDDDLKKKGSSTGTYSFLASLSKNIPDEKCHPTAKIFKANFNSNKEELTKKLFLLYNKNVFEDRIPHGTALEWNARLLCTAGYCYSKKVTHRDGKIDLEVRIVLSSKVLTTPDRLRDTLIHEMCHAATWIVDNVRDGHGSYWKAWANKARKAFPELPPIKTCHNYEINSKYVYRCTGCGYSIKRHRKSLDIERKRCGYCYGKFEIFINKVNKKGEQKLIPADTPKKQPTGFALFVQENYAKYKNKNSAEVMKLLGQEFRKMKVN